MTREISGRLIRSVLQLRDGFLDELSRRIAYVGLSVDDARDGLDGDSGESGDVIDGGFGHAEAL